MTTEITAALAEAKDREMAARWKRLRDCSLPAPDRRQIRADALTALVLGRLQQGRLYRRLDRDVTSEIIGVLIRLFNEIGGDVVTDADREMCGLPARGDLGWTPEELAVLENNRILQMLRPPQVLMADFKSQHLQVWPEPGPEPVDKRGNYDGRDDEHRWRRPR